MKYRDIQIGKRIRDARKEEGRSITWLANEVGCSTQAISQYERGIRAVNDEIILAIASALNIDPVKLLAPIQATAIPSLTLGDLNLSIFNNDHNFIRMAIAYSRLNEEAQEMAAGIVESIAQNPLCQKAENRYLF